MIQGEVLHPEERLSREEALRMYKFWAAYMRFNESNRGPIEGGKLADLIEIDRDYLTCSPMKSKTFNP
jgi:predicted amidohydrolase YtcJ